MTEILMPRIGQTVDELTIVEFKVKLGDTVKLGDVLFEVETDKALLPVESYAAGTVLKILHEEGDIVKVGQPCILIGKQGEGSGAAADKTSVPEAPKAEEPKQAETVAPVNPAVKAAAPVNVPKKPVPPDPRDQPPLASPKARKLLRDEAIPLSSLRGEFRDRIIKYADAIGIVESRRFTQNAPAAVYVEMQAEVRAAELRSYLDRLNKFYGTAVTVGDYIAYACCRSATKVPDLLSENINKINVEIGGRTVAAAGAMSLLSISSADSADDSADTVSLEISDLSSTAVTVCVKPPKHSDAMSLSCGREKSDGTMTLALVSPRGETAELAAFLTLIALHIEEPGLAMAL